MEIGLRVCVGVKALWTCDQDEWVCVPADGEGHVYQKVDYSNGLVEMSLVFRV